MAPRHGHRKFEVGSQVVESSYLIQKVFTFYETPRRFGTEGLQKVSRRSSENMYDEQRWLPAVRHRQHGLFKPRVSPSFPPCTLGEFPVNCIVIHSNFIPEYVIIDSGDHFTY